MPAMEKALNNQQQGDLAGLILLALMLGTAIVLDVINWTKRKERKP